MIAERKVAIVTGANTGVGYAIVQRLVQESPNPLIIILACRNKHRAQDALNSLHIYFNALQKKRFHQEQDKYRHDDQTEDRASGEKIGERNNLYHHPELKIELVDVGSAASVLAFNQRIRDQYRKVDYLFCNAGILPSTGIMWGKLVLDIFRAPMDVVIRSDVLVQPKQHLTEDGIGNVLACNVFGHYLMIRGLEDQLNKTEDDPGRVIWTSSMTAEKGSFSDDDWQGMDAKQPYESSKWVTDLLAIRLNEIWAGQPSAGTGMADMIAAGSESPRSDNSSGSSSGTESNIPVRRITRSTSKVLLVSNGLAPNDSVPPKKHIISIATQPGVVASGIGGLAAWIVFLRLALHYVLRFCGEPNQTITGYHGAQSNIFVALKQPVQKLDYRFKYGSCIGRTGKEILKVEKVVEYEEVQGKMVVENLEKLRLSVLSS
ncbi:hypothetical protein BC939DRAFT_472851 [Gamsiella multidivaricata]|uniref:uncharacterized protein n=1 Tax=Gamsiella multidivaricata TaxID=101098 RepID=UPI002220D82D|nr:uncharacterized protein BC939DRAFT_472851 [Gamsiella multidivaricata]KAG0365581.1 hypothetical protein BGZ54_006392 [Gamsiella multidivaricata]KAI7831747.1 hypothetical protein BC939DRAFT_472851 [Gamsiella multidivaricata]